MSILLRIDSKMSFIKIRKNFVLIGFINGYQMLLHFFLKKLVYYNNNFNEKHLSVQKIIYKKTGIIQIKKTIAD
jgi:hypothetical protein